MRTALLAGLAAAALAGAADAQVITEWVLTGEPGNQPVTAASGSAANVTGLDLSRGPGINPAAAVDSFSGTGWHTLIPDDYFSFGFSVEPGWEVVLNELWIGTRASNTGPGFLGLFHNGDGFSANLHTFVQTGTAFTYSIVDLSALGSLTGTVEFRVMALNNMSAGGGTVGSSGAFRFSDHIAGGNVTPVRLTGSVALSTGPGTPYCFGDGSGTACPCGNPGGPGQGCANSGGQGATLTAAGSTSVSAGNLVLTGANLPPGRTCYFFQGDTPMNGGNGAVFGDGLRCAGDGVVRLELAIADGSGSASTSIDLAATGGVSAGLTRNYQVWYQDPSGSPCGAGLNLSHGLAITWMP